MITRDLKPAFGAATLEAHTAGPSMPLRRSLGLRLGASLLALALSGCGMSQLERHTTAAGILHAGTGLAATIVDEGAREAAARAGDEAELTEALRPWRRAEAVQHLAAAAVDAYVAEVLVMAAGSEDTTRALRALRGAVSAYAALADLLATLGVDLPPVGRVLAVVGGAL